MREAGGLAVVENAPDTSRVGSERQDGREGARAGQDGGRGERGKGTPDVAPGRRRTPSSDELLTSRRVAAVVLAAVLVAGLAAVLAAVGGRAFVVQRCGGGRERRASCTAFRGPGETAEFADFSALWPGEGGVPHGLRLPKGRVALAIAPLKVGQGLPPTALPPHAPCGELQSPGRQNDRARPPAG